MDAVMTYLEVLSELESLWQEVFTTNLRYYVDWNRSEKMLE
jgi:hypothetical protein